MSIKYPSKYFCPNISALLNAEDTSLHFVIKTQHDSLQAVELSQNEYLLVFNGEKVIIYIYSNVRYTFSTYCCWSAVIITFNDFC